MNQNKRERKGNGGLHKTKNGNFEGRYVLHFKDGRKLEKSFSRKTIKEIDLIKARLKMLDVLDDDVIDVKIHRWTNEIKLIRRGEISGTGIGKNMTVEEYVDYFLWEHRRRGVRGKMVKESTFSDYVDRMRHIKIKLGKKAMKKVTFEEIESVLQEIHEETCDTTARQVRDLTYSMFKFAKKDRAVETNVLEDTEIHFRESNEKKEKKIIQPEDEEKFVKYCIEKGYYDILMIYITGCRTAELAGITWNKVDMEKGIVHLKNGTSRVIEYELKNGKIVKKGSKIATTDLKSKSSDRPAKLPKWYIDLLKEHKENQKELAKKNRIEFKETDFVFTTVTYKAYIGDYICDKFRKIMNELQIKGNEELTPHCLRHGFCSRALRKGIDLKTTSKLMGHENIQVTAQWYAHLGQETLLEATDKINEDMEEFVKEDSLKTDE